MGPKVDPVKPIIDAWLRADLDALRKLTKKPQDHRADPCLGTRGCRTRGWTLLGVDPVRRYGVHPGHMRTKQVADRAGVNTQTLRYYERRGLLARPPRSPAGYRDYPLTTVEVLRFVKRAQELGFTLAEIEELLHLDTGGPDSCDAARALAEARLADLDRRIADLHRMRDSLAKLVSTCDRPRNVRQCPLLGAIQANHPTEADSPRTSR